MYSLWTPTHGRAKALRPAWTCIQQLCEDTGCSPEDLPEAMNDREKWRERVRDIRATSTTWWWWWILVWKTPVVIIILYKLIVQIICTLLYGFKYSYLILIITFLFDVFMGSQQILFLWMLFSVPSRAPTFEGGVISVGVF